MKRVMKRALRTLLSLLLLPPAALAGGHGGSHGGYGTHGGYGMHGGYRGSSSSHHTRYGTTYRRSPEVRRQFQRMHPCPSTGRTWGRCDGYVVDHVQPLACGGADAVGNMAWQTVEAGRAKDAWELNCKGHP